MVSRITSSVQALLDCCALTAALLCAWRGRGTRRCNLQGFPPPDVDMCARADTRYRGRRTLEPPLVVAVMMRHDDALVLPSYWYQSTTSFK